MLYVIDNANYSNNHFVDENNLDDFSFKLISSIRKNNPNTFLKVNYGYENIHIEQLESKADINIYTPNHPIFKKAYKKSSINELKLIKIA